MNTCRRCTVLTNSSAISITLTLKKNRNFRTIRRIRVSRRDSDPEACSTAWPLTRTMRPKSHDGDVSANRPIKDTGPLTKKRMETVDEEITDRAIDWMEKQVKADQPFFLWYNSTAMHFRTHVAEKNLGKSGQDPYSDRMVVHDEQIGQMLDKLDELGIADNTIVMYSTDNGPENDTWPDGANTPFRGQKDTNWEGGWRVPSFIRWPGKIEAGSVLNGIVSHIDMLPTLLAIAGDDRHHREAP